MVWAQDRARDSNISLFDARIHILISTLYLFTLHSYSTDEEDTLAKKKKFMLVDLALVCLSPVTIELVRFAHQGFLRPWEVGWAILLLTPKAQRDCCVGGIRGFVPNPYHVWSWWSLVDFPISTLLPAHLSWEHLEPERRSDCVPVSAISSVRQAVAPQRFFWNLHSVH